MTASSWGRERVRRDFNEYLKQVPNEDIDKLDDLPVITTLDEHNLLVTLLKNRISFLQNSYKLMKNSVQHYEYLLSTMRTFPALPSPSVIVQTGGNMNSRNYNAANWSNSFRAKTTLLPIRR